MNTKILLLGFFGLETNSINGQTSKTRNIKLVFEKYIPPNYRIAYFDTETFRSNYLNVIKMFYKIYKSDIVIYMPAQGNLFFFSPIIFIISKFNKCKIILIPTGGWFMDFIKMYPVHRFIYSNVNSIMLESKTLIANIQKVFKLSNLIYLPNFRVTDFKPKTNINNTNYLKIIFMARINKNKGVDEIFNLDDYFNKKYKNHNYKFYIYGPLDPNYKQEFYIKLNDSKNVIFGGLIPSEDIYTTLNDHDILILPTRYYTEGFPGSILDAYISGIPVIVTDWLLAKEFVSNNTDGFIVNFENPLPEIVSILEDLYLNRIRLDSMKNNAFLTSKNFDKQFIFNTIMSKIQ
jgi:glycosyltransferase involved in cell wall biosynthesis